MARAAAAGTPQAAPGHVAAVAALIGAVLLAWAVLALVPGFSDRTGAIPAAATAASVRAIETRAALLTSAGIVAAALLLALLLHQPIAIGDRAPRLLVMASAAGGLAVAAALGLSWAAGAVRLVSFPALGAGLATWALGWLLVAWSALGEEMLFRGLLQPVLRRAWGSGPALVLGALAFAFVHYLGGWRDPLSLVNIFLAAWWFGLIALRTGGVLVPTMAHFGWNGVEALVFGASPNPGLGAYGALLDVDLRGAARFGGSEDGLNASVTATVLLILLIATMARRRRIGDGRGKG